MADTRDILVRLLGEETVSKMAGRAEKGLDRFGDSLEATERDAKDLDRQIGEVERNLAVLSVAFARAQDAADKTDISRAMRKQQSELRKLSKAKDLLPDFGGEGSKSAAQFAAGFAKQAPSAIRGAIGSGPGAIIGGLVAAGMVPTLSAALAGAVVGGVGLGGVVGGLKLAAQDARVQAAGKALGEIVMGDLEESGSAFVGPTIQAIGVIRSAWDDVSDDVDGALKAASRYVVPLARGVGDAVRELAPGIRKAAEAAGPIVREISQGLPRLGRALGDVMSDFADDADEGASAIRWLFMIIEGGIRTVGGAVHAFAALYRAVLDVDEVAVDIADHLWGWIPGFGGKIDDAKKRIAELKGALDEGGESGKTAGEKLFEGFQRAGDAADTSAEKVKTWADVVRESIDQAIASENANIRLEQAIDDAAKAAKDGADKGIDRNTEAGRKNRLALLGIAEAANAASQQILANTGSHELAAQATERARKKFLSAADAMGVEKGEAERLANQLFGIPRSVTTTVRALTDTATGKLIGFEKKIKQLDGRVITVRTRITPAGEYIPGVGTQTRASGGPVRAGQPYLVGEEGPELVTPTRDGWVHDAKATARMREMLGPGQPVAALAGGGGAGTTLVQYNTVTVQAGYVVSEQQLEDRIARVLDDLRRKGRA